MSKDFLSHNGTTSFSQIKTFRDFLVDKQNPIVMVTLLLGGKSFLENASFSLELRQYTNNHDEFTIVVPDTALDSFKGYIFENSKNLLGERLTINYHRYGVVVQSFTGIIAKIVNKKNQGGGYGNLHITGYAPSILLENGKDCQSFENKTLAEIIEAATQEYPSEAKIKVEGGVNTERSVPYVVQYKESDYQFIRRLARRYGEFFYYNGTQLIFGNKAQNLVEVEEGSELIDVEFELLIKPQKFSYLTYNIEKGELQERPSYLEQTQNKTNPFAQVAKNASEKVFQKVPQVYSSNFSENEVSGGLEDLVRREKESREQLMQVRGRSREPQLKIGGFIKLSDINNKAMETYRIIEIKHYQSGYEYYNEFVAIPDVFVAYYFDENAYPKSEQQPAKVVDNNDPEGLGRVRVQFVWQLKRNEKSPWLRVVQPHAGGGKGFYFVPEVGEEVLVDFENQNPERPFVVGSHYNGNQKSGFATNDNKIKAIQTRSGHKLIFNEDESIIIADKSGNEIKLDTNGGNIEISAPQNICLNAGNNMDIQVGNNLTFSVGNTAMMNIFQKMFISTPFMQQLVADYFHTQAGKALINSENEIKIEARETNVAGTQKLLMHSDEEATVNSKGVAQLHGEQKNNYSNISADYETQKEEIKPKCVVYFRPHNNWSGEFGFDWIRTGDTGRDGDKKWYRDIIGKRTVPDVSEYTKLLREYKVFKINFLNDFYVTPWISLYKGKKAKLSLKLNIEESPKSLKFRYDTKLFKLNKEEINLKDKGKHTLADYLEITCIGTFNGFNTYIEVLTEDEQVVGSLRFYPNGKVDRKKLDIVFARVNVATFTGREAKGNIMGEKELFEKLFAQTFIKPNIIIDESVDLRDDTNFMNGFLAGNIIRYGYDRNKKSELHKYLLENYDLRNKYPDAIILYFFELSAIDLDGVETAGEAYEIPSDNAIVFKKEDRNKVTAFHECLHCLGLYHTYSTNSRFTLKKWATENIMDYSNIRYALWKWQWDIIRKHNFVK